MFSPRVRIFVKSAKLPISNQIKSVDSQLADSEGVGRVSIASNMIVTNYNVIGFFMFRLMQALFLFRLLQA